MQFHEMVDLFTRVALAVLKFMARLPVAVLVIGVALFGSFLLFMTLYRVTQWLWTHVLSTPW
ncbi:MAG: hypothetical protein IT445_18125 [Phycisphaeraceae bacterium]|nr:hypothetical protein [Phycisphaeraceae bacterium]